MDISKIWGEIWRQSPLAAIIALALITYMRGSWMSATACEALRQSDARETVELRKSRDEFKTIAFNCTGIVVERAQQSVAVNEQASEKAQTQRKVVATVKIPVTPLTSQEKADVAKPVDAEPATLNKTLKASNQVLQKNDLKSAQVTQAIKQ